MTAFALIMSVMCWSYNRPVIRYRNEMDYPVSWCVFPFFMSQCTFLILFWFGIIYINSDVPFMQHVNMYQVIRTGRRRWVAGQMGGIFIRSFVAVLFTVLCTILPLMPGIELTNEWGKLLRSAVLTDATTKYWFDYKLYYEIFSEYTPLGLMGLCVLLCTVIAGFMGMLMFLVSLYVNKELAVVVAMVMAVMLFFVENTVVHIRHVIALFVPAVWAEAARIASPEMGYYWLPSLRYMFVFLTVGIGLMAVLIVHRVKYIEFDWENDDI